MDDFNNQRNEEQDELEFIRTSNEQNNGKMLVSNKKLTEDELLMLGIIE